MGRSREVGPGLQAGERRGARVRFCSRTFSEMTSKRTAHANAPGRSAQRGEPAPPALLLGSLATRTRVTRRATGQGRPLPADRGGGQGPFRVHPAGGRPEEGCPLLASRREATAAALKTARLAAATAPRWVCGAARSAAGLHPPAQGAAWGAGGGARARSEPRTAPSLSLPRHPAPPPHRAVRTPLPVAPGAPPGTPRARPTALPMAPWLPSRRTRSLAPQHRARPQLSPRPG